MRTPKNGMGHPHIRRNEAPSPTGPDRKQNPAQGARLKTSKLTKEAMIRTLTTKEIKAGGKADKTQRKHEIIESGHST